MGYNGGMKKLLTLAGACLLAGVASAGLTVKDGDKVAFMGDSITQFGNDPGGYVQLVMKGFEVLGVDVKKLAAGTSGNKSNDMLKRLDRSVLKAKPQFMTLSCGVNDVWHGARGVELEDYKKNISEILDKCAASNVTVIVLTATVIGEDHPERPMNAKLVGYNEFLRETAKARGLALADVAADLQEAMKEFEPKHGVFHYTRDGVHMAWDGNRLMARGVLKAFGATADDIVRIEAAWRTMPGTSQVSTFLSRADYERYQQEAKTRGVKVSDVIAERLSAK